MATEFIQYAGQMVIDSIVLYTSDKNHKLDISLLFKEINFFEDIYSPSIHGSISMVEGFNLTSNFPILGEELLELKCHTPTFDTKISKIFAVTGIQDKIISNGNTQLYIINFITVEALVDLNTKVFRAYSGTPSDSAIQIFTTYFPSSHLKVEDSVNPLQIVSPSVSPFSMINLLASKAIDTSGSGLPNFLFYEDNQSFNFVSLSTLFNQPPLTTLNWSEGLQRDKTKDGESTRSIDIEYSNVKEMTIDNLFNTIEKNMSGALGHKVFEIDIVRKAITKRFYNYLDNFNDVVHLNKYPVNSNHLIYSNDAIIEASVIHPYLHDNFPQDRDAEILVKRPSILAQNEFIKLELVIHGRTDMKVGQTIIFEMGSFKTSSEDGRYKDDFVDPYYSGKYLIAAMQHRITLNRHESIIEIVKDSFNKEIDFSRI